MRFKKYMVNEISFPSWMMNMVDKVKKELHNLSFSEFEKKCAEAFYKIANDKDLKNNEKNWDEFWQMAVENGIKNDPMLDKFMKMNKKDTDFISTERGKRSVSAMDKYFGIHENINEDAKHWWDLVKTEAFPTLAFYPALQVWLELDKVLKGTEYSGKVIAFYAAFWLVLMSGKYVAGWMKWKKENPEEYGKERAVGKGGLV